MKKFDKKIITFHYKRKNKRPKRLKNDAFVIYSPDKIVLNPGERKTVNMQIKISIPDRIEGTCRLLIELSNQKLELMNSHVISQEYDSNREIDFKNKNDLPLWNLNFELFNGDFIQTFKILKGQEIGYFHTVKDRGEEIRFKYKMELC